MRHFKFAFILVSIGLAVGQIVYGLFEINFNDSNSIINLILRSITIGIIVGIILGLLNLFFKIQFREKR
jgi:uncharacterized membrane protein